MYFMKNALLAVLVISPLFGILSTMVVHSRMSFFSDALGHSAFTGMAIGALCGFSEPTWAAVLFSLVFALLFNFVRRRTRLASDTVIGVFSSTAVALGIFISTLGSRSFTKFNSLLIGDILSVEPGKIGLLALILLLVLVLGVFMALNSRQFLTTANFKTIGNYMANDMIIGAFLTISLIAGNTDFSVGSNMGCSAFVCGLLLNAGLPVWVCILVGLCVGVAIGALNAFCIVQLKVVPMIATMGTWMAFKGAGLMIINSSTLSNFPASFKAIVQDWNLFGVSTLIVVMLIVAVVAALLLKYVSFFHQAYFIGSNPESARLSGINVTKFVYVLYMIIGFFAALAGILATSRYGSAPASLGQGVEFRVISALLIGGVSLSGGEGSILGTFLGILLMALISNALTLFAIDSNLQNVLIGSIMVVSVAIDEANRRRQK